MEKYIIIVFLEAGMVQNKLIDEGETFTFGSTDNLFYKEVKKKPILKKTMLTRSLHKLLEEKLKN